MKALFLASLATVGVFGQNDGKAKTDSSLPEGPGKAVTERVCTACHGLENVVRARMTKERWGTVVDDMVSRGAAASDSEIDQIVDYLAANFGRPKPREESKP
ncbi:MAG TPA: cytochrome c [Bryobacteraceae bacterium]|nr:cytochrome c [Bryobacteraceae bacterium]